MNVSDTPPLHQIERIKSRFANNNKENCAKCDKRTNNKESEAEEVDGNKVYNDVNTHISEENDDNDGCN